MWVICGKTAPCYGPPVPPYVQSLGGLGLRRSVVTLYLNVRLERTETGNVQRCSVSRLTGNVQRCSVSRQLLTALVEHAVLCCS